MVDVFALNLKLVQFKFHMSNLLLDRNGVLMRYIKNIRKYYSNQSFYPRFLGMIINPFYFARSALALQVSHFAKLLDGKLLDIGCGTAPYKRLFNVSQYTTLDIDTEHTRKVGIADHYYDGNIIPFGSGAFDSIICNQVFEHVFNPEEFLSEVARVLNSEGYLLMTVPFVWDEHEQPFDYARYTYYGLKSILEKSGFQIIRHEKTCADVTVIFQIFNLYIFKTLRNAPRIIRVPVSLALYSCSNISGLLLRNILPKNGDLYLDQIILAKRVNERIQ